MPQRFRSHRLAGVGLLMVSTALGAYSARAQETSSSAQSVAEVVVTAQKREERLQDVPATLSVVGAEQLSQFHVTQLADIGAYVPGLQVDSAGTPGQTQLTIRGIAPVSANATVASYIDDTPFGSSSFHNRSSQYSLDLLPYDIQRIEVLEGPQGTLYGANALGGIVRYVTTQPNLDRLEARAGGDVQGISNGGVGGGGRAMVDGPILQDRLGFLASYAYEDTPGYIDNARTGEKDQNEARQESARFALLFKITPDADLRLGALYQHTHADGNGTVALDPATLQPLRGALLDDNYLPNVFKSQIQYYTADLNWNLGWAKLVSATSYSEDTHSVQQDATPTYQPLLSLVGGPADGTNAFQLLLKTKKFTQEVRLSSPANSRFEWLVGGYYDRERDTNVQLLTAQDASSGAPLAGLNPLFVGRLPSTYEEIAGFGNATYHFTDWFDLSAGIRYARNRQKFTEIIDDGSPILPAASVPGKSDEGVWTYSVNPRLHLSKDVMLYVRVASGYQPGGPNTALPGVPTSVSSSTLTNYEGGVKSTFWNGRALLNASIFDLEWDNIQVVGVSPGGVSYSTNGGTARSRGFEGEGSVTPITGLTFGGNVTYTDAVFTEDVPSVGAFSGNKLPFVPLWAGSLRADYAWTLAPDWRAHAGAGLRMVGPRYSLGPDTVSEFKTKGYGALDLNADVTHGRYVVRVFFKNVTDQRAYLTDTYLPGLSGGVSLVEAAVIQPRTIGLSLDVKF